MPSINRPTLTPEQKSQLVYELITWAKNNGPVQNADTPKLSLLELIGVILDDSEKYYRGHKGEVLIRELMRSGPWGQVRPFIKNIRDGCITRVTTAPYGGKCDHGPEMHVNGKCTGVHQHRREKPDCPPDWTYWDSRRFFYEDVPCDCNGYKTNQKW